MARGTGRAAYTKDDGQLVGVRRIRDAGGVGQVDAVTVNPLPGRGLAVPAMALNGVNTSWTVHCVFTTSSPCTVYVTDHVSTFMSGAARMQSRIHQGEPGSTETFQVLAKLCAVLTEVSGVLTKVDRVPLIRKKPVVYGSPG